MTFTEVPVIFPSHVAVPQRYVVSDVNQTIVRVPPASSDGKPQTVSSQQQQHQQQHQQQPSQPLMMDHSAVHRSGSASMSSLQFSNHSSVMVTTAVLLQEPNVLSVSLFSSQQPDMPVMVELDLATECHVYGGGRQHHQKHQHHHHSTVKIQAFVQSSSTAVGEECLRLVLVDENAVVLTLLLRSDTLAPFDGGTDAGPVVQVVQIRELLGQQQSLAMKEAVAGSHLHKTMVAFYAPHKLVVALSPLLLSVDLNSEKCAVWLESQCLEEMRARQSALGSLFSKILGPLQDTSSVDMRPTAALCVSNPTNPLLDPTFVFTIHADGHMKRWLVDDQVLLPLEVCPIGIDDNATLAMPHPRDWSDVYNSVYLSARLYSEVYVLAVNIQTTSHPNFDAEEAVNDDSSSSTVESNPNLHLTVIHGQLQGRTRDEIVMSSQQLRVPRDALSLVDMDFLPNLSSCSLMALFRSQDINTRAGTTCTVLYPPNLVSIISTQPVVALSDHYLDGVAQAERARIDALVLCDELEGIATTAGTTLEEELHDMDTRYMSYLFRPAYPRGNGTVTPPTAHDIRTALQKVIFGGRSKHSSYTNTSTSSSENYKSIELETLQAMQEWRILENRKLQQSMSPVKPKQQQQQQLSPTMTTALPVVPAADIMRPAASAMTIYDSYVEAGMEDARDTENDYDEVMNDPDEITEFDLMKLEQERSLLLEMHSRRWKCLLLAIWEEEQDLRSPLGLFPMESSMEARAGQAVFIRSGFTSIIARDDTSTNSVDSTDALAEFDAAAIKLIKAIEADEKAYKKLFSTEQRIWNHMVKAQLDDMTPSDFAEECSRVVDFAFDSARGAVFSVQEQQQLGRSLGTISIDEYFDLLQETPRDRSLPGLGLVSGRSPAYNQDASSDPSTPRSQIANEQVRQAACALTVRCIDSSRRLLLSRYLLVSYLVRSSRVSTAAFYLYLRSIAVLWASAQRVAMPTAFMGASRSHFGGDERPLKRLSFGDSTASILDNGSNTTTCLDNLLILEIQKRDSSCPEKSPLHLIVSLGRQLFCSSLRSTIPTAADVASGKLWKLLPELGFLPPSSKPEVATDYPRIALRLVAPLVALASTQESPNVAMARRETLAECLLVESHKQVLDSVKSSMRVKACELLASPNSSYGNANSEDVQSAFQTLCTIASDGTPQLDARAIDTLAQKLQLILYGNETEIRNEVRSLVKMKSVVSLFSPLLMQHASYQADIEHAVNLLAPKFLRLSNLMRRVEILEHHVGKSAGSNELVLEFITSAIQEVSSLFPSDHRAEMPENLMLYEKLFHNAISFGEWNKAYDACVNSPSALERRLGNFKRLANSMVDAGALKALLDKCSTLASSAMFGEEECVDLYEIAVNALEEVSARDLYLVRANSENATTAAPDYQGSLYALHVSRGQWKSAAESLDMRFVNAMQALAKDPTGSQQDSGAAVVRDKLIVEDLVLASVGATNAIGLVDEIGSHFIVSGDCGHSSSLQMHAMREFEDASGPKRQRDLGSGRVMKDNEERSSLQRMNQFMNVNDFRGRAAWSFVFRSLCLDTTIPFVAARAACISKGNPCVDKPALDQLTERGYYVSALLLLMAMTKSVSSEVVGQSAFHNGLHYLVETIFVPLSLDGSPKKTAGSFERPSLSQLRRALDSFENQSGISPYVIHSTSTNHSKALDYRIQALSDAFVYKLTRLHTDAEHPVALEVANYILNAGDRITQLPCWLEQLLLGNLTETGGLFGGRPKPGCSRLYNGDPSALLSLYTRQGMLLEACNVVSTVLSANHDFKSREERAPNRLPEKGDIDFVPYNKIDILWNLMEKTIAVGNLNSDEERALRNAQSMVKLALEKHFALLKVSEMGIRSARSLQSGIFLS